MKKIAGHFNALVLDPDKGWGLEDVYVKESEGTKTLGHKWHYGNSLVHLVARTNGNLTPVELPPKIGEPPEKLFRALFWDKESSILFTLSSAWEKFKTIGIYILIGIELLFIFLVFSSLMG
jgi:hypothetical protein